MTQVNIVDTSQRETVNITEAKVGNWYKVHEYEPNKEFVGKIGVLVKQPDFDWTTKTASAYSVLVTPDGTKLSNESFILQPISKITITLD